MTLINGDSMEIMTKMQSDSVDMVLTDPPYGMSFRSNHRKIRYDGIKNDSDLGWIDEFVKEAYRISKMNTAHYVFCSFHNVDIFKQALERYFKIKNLLVWEKNNTSMGDLRADFAPKYELIWFVQKGRKLINGRRDPNILHFDRTGNKIHPTQKPVDLTEYLIEKFSDIGNIVFDPFMGSGTTGVACKNKNREFIGIEWDKKFYDIAVSRI